MHFFKSSTTVENEFSKKSANVEPSVCDSKAVFWPFDDHFYPGTLNSAKKDGRLNIHYDDGQTEGLEFLNGVWKFSYTRTANCGLI